VSVPSSGGVFISYRRQDASGWARLLYDRLAEQLGDGQVFMDVDTMTLGMDWVDVITKSVGSCHVLLAIIGPDWLTITNDEGRRRLELSNDTVRLEIQAALERGIPIVPILVDEAEMPGEEDLPSTLRTLSRRHGAKLHHESFRQDVSEVVKAVKAIVESRNPTPPQLDATLEWLGGDRYLLDIANVGGSTLKDVYWELDVLAKHNWKIQAGKLQAYPLPELRPGQHAKVPVTISRLAGLTEIYFFAERPDGRRYKRKKILFDPPK
jgi:hypothetical protein